MVKNVIGVEESASYDNYLDVESRREDRYRSSLDNFFDEPVEVPLVHGIPKNNVEVKDYVRLIKVNMKNIEDHLQFCNAIGHVIPYRQNEMYFPVESNNSLFSDDVTQITDIDIELIRPHGRVLHEKTDNESALDVEEDENFLGEKEWMAHWQNMPLFEQNYNKPYKFVMVKVRTDADLEKFAEVTQLNITDKTKYAWYPALAKSNNLVKRWIGEKTVPSYPMYIISKGRHETMHTSRTFAMMQLHHYIIIEPQDHDRYVEALEKFKINPYATLVVAPFSNHGDGPGRARNYAWDHSIALGAERHWVFDDNIKDFYRLHLNSRYRVMTGAIFNAMEDFVDRFTNIMIAGPQYFFFCADSQKYPPYVLNTRIYSALLIKNDCKHRWRGRYNEDTDLSLRVLKDGDATIQFNAFLQGKMGTQLLKGGNTEEFYHKEGDTDTTAWREGRMNASGTINKSKMLVDMHPDVATLVWKYGRWHHFVDYSQYRKIKLIPKEGVTVPKGTNNYGMSYVDDYDISQLQ